MELGKAVWRRLGQSSDGGPWLRVGRQSGGGRGVDVIQRQRLRPPIGVWGTQAAQSRGHPPVVMQPQGHQMVLGTGTGVDGDL